MAGTSPPSLSFPGRKGSPPPPPRTPAHTARQALASLSPETAFLFFSRKKKNGKGDQEEKSTDVEEKQSLAVKVAPAELF